MILNTLKIAVIVLLFAIAFATTPVIFIVEVACECGRWITIRGAAGTVKVCWTCSRMVWFSIIGTAKAVGKTMQVGQTKPTETKARIIWRGK